VASGAVVAAAAEAVEEARSKAVVHYPPAYTDCIHRQQGAPVLAARELGPEDAVAALDSAVVFGRDR
jgi:hypothetical protein